MQSVWTAHCLSDEPAIKRLVKEIKESMGVRWGDGSGSMIYLKKLAIGQTVQRMIGYVRKDRHLTTFRNRNKGITPDMIALGIAEHESLKMSYLDNKILVTKANLFNKAYVKWYSEYAPAKLSFSQIMCNLLNDNKHALVDFIYELERPDAPVSGRSLLESAHGQRGDGI